VDPERFPSEATVEITRADRVVQIPVTAIIEAGRNKPRNP